MDVCLFKAAELLSANGTLLWPILRKFILQSVGQNKHFIEHFIHTCISLKEAFTLEIPQEHILSW